VRTRTIVSLTARALFLASVVAAAAPARAAQVCQITFGMNAAAPVGGIGLDVSYGSAGGAFTGSGDGVACSSLAAGAFGVARDDDGTKHLELGLVSPGGVAVPADIWRCTFVPTGANPTAGSFVVSIDDAVDTEGAPVPATASVTEVTCAEQSVCGNSDIEGAEECDDGGASAACDGTCHLTANSQRCDVVFRVSGELPIGGVQFHVGYENTGGEFQGAGLGVACKRLLPEELTAFFDVDASSQLRMAMVSPVELDVPVEPFQCTFVTTGVPIVLKNFTFEDVIATDSTLGTVPVKIGARLTNCVRPYCGDGITGTGEACDDGNDVDNDMCTNACTVAKCGDAVVRTGIEQCDDGNSASGDCCSPSCAFEAITSICRSPAGVCDQTETCTGTSATCPADSKKTSVCRGIQGICDIPETCDGSSDTCGSDVRSTLTCRPATSECDVTETCSGLSVTCPADVAEPTTTACTSDGSACTTDRCNGLGACIHANNNSACDDGLFCNGSDTCGGGTCSLHAGNPCPGADADADCSESCSEMSDVCTANDPNASSCNDGNGQTAGDQCLDGQCVGGPGELCGDADGSGAITATDALRALRKAVGQSVTCPLTRCDTDHNGLVQSGDALRILKKAVSQPVSLSCPV
jgi:cysteine-rich repeat protein